MSVNKVILLGNITKDIELKKFDNGCLANVGIATNEKGFTAKNGTVIPDRADFHNVVFTNRLAEVAEKYLKKGDKVYVEGKLRQRQWETKEGEKRYSTEVVVERMEMLGGKLAEAIHNPQAEREDTDLPF